MHNLSWHIISLKFPSIQDRLGAYALNIARGLAKQGLKTHIWYPGDNTISGFGDLSLFPNLHLQGKNVGSQKEFLRAVSEDEAGPSPGDSFVLFPFDPRSIDEDARLSLLHWFATKSNCDLWLIVQRLAEKTNFTFRLPTLRRNYLNFKIMKTALEHSTKIIVCSWLHEQKLKKSFPELENRIRNIPIPSNVDFLPSKLKSRNLRKAFANHAKVVLGTFGSFFEPGYLENMRFCLAKVLTNHPERIWLLLGRGSQAFTEKLRLAEPGIAEQIQTAGELDVTALSAHIQACDVMFQPYAQGVNTSRTSVMVGLSHGKTVVTTQGPHTDPLWQSLKCILLLPCNQPGIWVSYIESLIENPGLCKQLGQKALKAYENNFSLDQCISKMLRD